MKKLNWIAIALFICLSLTGRAQFTVLEIVGDTVCTRGDSVTVSVRATGFQDVAGFQIRIYFDAAKLGFGRSLDWHASVPGYLESLDTVGGQYSMVWLSGSAPATLPDGDILFSLRFKAKGGMGDVMFSGDPSEVQLVDTLAIPMMVFTLDGIAGQMGRNP